jgi:hypothetical protein
MATAKFGEDFEFPDEKEERLKKEAASDEGGENIEVEVEDDTPPADRGRKPMKEPVEDPTEEELASYDDKVQQRIKKFTRGYHDERRAKEEALREREAAETFARKMYEENKKLQEQLSSGSKQFIETSKNAADIELVAAKKKFKEAYESGDADLLTEAQSEIAEATLKVNRAKELKPIEVEEQEFKAAPVEKAAPVLARRTQKWLDANQDWWGKDEEMTAAAMGLDKKLQREYGPDYIGGDEYFKTIDRTMRKRFPEFFSEDRSNEEDDDLPRKKRSEPADEDEPPRRATKSAAVVAPATRSTPPSRIRLKASEANTARRLGVPLEEYARQVALLNRGE